MLMATAVPLVRRSDCIDYHKQINISMAMFCAGKEGVDTCKGDSGGPLVCRRGKILPSQPQPTFQKKKKIINLYLFPRKSFHFTRYHQLGCRLRSKEQTRNLHHGINVSPMDRSKNETFIDRRPTSKGSVRLPRSGCGGWFDNISWAERVSWLWRCWYQWNVLKFCFYMLCVKSLWPQIIVLCARYGQSIWDI